MLIRKQLALIVAAMLVAVTTQVHAQFRGGPTPGAIGGQAMGQDAFNTNSFAADFDPSALEYDFQTFAPLDVSEYGGGPKARSGFYSRYDRTYLSLTRPDGGGPGNGNATFVPTVDAVSLVGGPTALQPGPNIINTPMGNDFISGNHFNVGYTDHKGEGWEFDYLKSAGGFFSNGERVNVQNLAFTDTEIHSLQLNKVFRSDLSRGGYIEPFTGIRYLGLSDNFTQGTREFALVNINNPNAPANTLEFANTRFSQKARNSAVGGHVGIRYHQQRGRWSLGSNMNLAGMYNSQRAQASTHVVFPSNNLQLNTSNSKGNSSSFVPIIDLGVTATYGITRDISFRMGGQLMHMWDGVNRVNTLPAKFNPNLDLDGRGTAVAITQENVTLAGFSLGIEWRR